MASKSWMEIAWQSHHDFDSVRAPSLRIRNLHYFAVLYNANIDAVAPLALLNVDTIKSMRFSREPSSFVEALDKLDRARSSTLLSRLEKVYISWVQVPRAEFFVRCSNLRCVYVDSHYGLEASIIIGFLSGCSATLEELGVLARLSHDDLDLLRSFPRLKRLHVLSLNSSYFDLARRGVQTLANLRKLHQLMPRGVGLNVTMKEDGSLISAISGSLIDRFTWEAVVREFAIDLNVRDLDDSVISDSFSLRHAPMCEGNNAFFWALDSKMIDVMKFNYFFAVAANAHLIDVAIVTRIFSVELDRAATQYNLPPSVFLWNEFGESIVLMYGAGGNLSNPGIMEMLRLVLQRGLSMSDFDGKGETVVHRLVASLELRDSISEEAVRLHSLGADFNMKNAQGKTPIEYEVLDKWTKEALLSTPELGIVAPYS